MVDFSKYAKECFIVDRNMKPIDDADYAELLDDKVNN